MADKKQQDQQENKFTSFIKGVIGIGALAYAGKKVLDLYTESENGSVMTSREYEEEVSNIKENYIEVNSGNKIELDSEELFDRSKVQGDELADSLFLIFLDQVENMIELPDKVFKISDIEKLLPFHLSNIEDEELYNYSIMKMLSNLDGRDYIRFNNNRNLSDTFAQECNNPHRDSKLWANRYADEKFIINPIYIKGYGEYTGGKNENRLS